ncbi:PREDICTED: uncharacterized protein LOC109473223 [Branchiostoma belcheri]|uniref:Uncharacterized protein LOC109473223 n=1 Tax=Branchiostoma belcheri TaxID=7741 RepID=A0A6P4YHA1_BRABE|nr:PREDICTED: uncharacterized protein LOC109473223 [Branchiostoma belcheri]XP_019628655.1 PREDICTED: uncharacterized protein LOC109473223 [Branchiostoma belcheri]XP_019628656.1 PREDICTED: uncharacterized protein LOC109473223 [Branchiostoma belcheri]
MPSTDNTTEGENVSGTAEEVSPSFKAAKSILLTVMSAIAISFAGEFTAIISKEGLPNFQMLFLKRFIELLTLIPILVFCRPKLTGKTRRQNIILFLFSIFTNAVMIAHMLSCVYTVPGIAFGIMQGLMPFLVACIGFLFLKESLFLADVCGIFISVTGVVLVVVGNTQVDGMSTKLLVLSIVIPLTASFVIAPEAVFMRYLTGILEVPIVTSMLYMNLVGSVALLGITYSAETPVWTMSLRTVLYVVGLGFCKSLSNIFLLAGLKNVKAYISTTVRMFVIPFTLMLDYFFLQKVPNSFHVAGVVLVMLGVVFVSAHTWWRERQKERRV